MILRVVLTGLAFAVTSAVAAQLCALLASVTDPARAEVAPAHALIGFAFGLLAAYQTWTRSAAHEGGKPDHAARADAPIAPSESNQKEPFRPWRSLLQFAVLWMLTTVVISAMIDPAQGILRFIPTSGAIFPGFLIASLATALMRWDAARQNGTGNLWQYSGLEPAAHRIGQRAGTFAGDTAAAKGASRLGRVTGAYRLGGSSARGGPDWSVLAALFGTGCFFFAIGLMKDAGPAILISSAAFGGAAAISYNRETARVFRLAAFPGLHDLALLALCAAPLLCLMISIEMALAPVALSHPAPLALALTYAGKVLAVVGQILVAAPLLAALVRQAPPAGERRPLWPLLAGFIGGEIVLVVLAAQWGAMTGPAFAPYPDWAAAASSATAFPPLGLPMGAGLVLWLQALTADRREGLDWDSLFPASIKGCMAVMTVGVIGCVITQGARTQSWNVAQAEAGMVTGFVWLYALWQMIPMRPAGAGRGLLGWVTITIAFYLSALASNLVGAGRDWASLLMLFTVPIAIASWVLTVWLMPRIMRRVLS